MTEIKLKRKRRKRGILDKLQKATREGNREIVLKAYDNLVNKGGIPTISTMEKEVGRLCKKADMRPLTRPTIYFHWNPIRKEREKQELSSLTSNLGVYDRLLEQTDTTYQQILHDIEEVKKSVLKRAKVILSGKYLKLLNSRWDYLEATRSTFHRRINLLEHSLSIQTSAKQETWYFKYTMQQELVEFLMKLFYLYFYGLGFYRKPESLSPITLQITFDPFKGAMNSLRERINLAEWRLINGRLVQDFNEAMDQLLKDDVEHFRLIAIANKNFDEDAFKRFKKNVFKNVKNRILRRLKKEGMDGYALGMNWELRLKKNLKDYKPNLGDLFS